MAGKNGTYLIRGAAILGGDAEDLLIRDGFIAAKGADAANHSDAKGSHHYRGRRPGGTSRHG
ncbi:MAG: hypothetical protein NVS2B15_06080 [Pseudarthrobacter sp.]